MQEEIQEVKVYHRTIPTELDLPVQFDLLHMIQKVLDNSINMCHSRQLQATFSNLKSYVEGQCNRTFMIKHIQQMLELVPWMYNHKWEIKFGKPDLVLSFPENLEQLLSKQETIPSTQSLYGAIPG